MTMILDWLLTPQRVAIHRPSATAVVADLHLGYQEARRQSGDAIPLLETGAVLSPLLHALELHQAKRLLIAGDLFEKAFDGLLWHEFQALLSKTGVRFMGLVPGNHDRRLEDAAADLPLLPEGEMVGGWRIVHGDGPLPETPAVLGHFHPCISHRGRKVPCYLTGARRLVLPAYSRDAAGANALVDNRWRGCRCLAIVAGKVIDCGSLSH